MQCQATRWRNILCDAATYMHRATSTEGEWGQYGVNIFIMSPAIDPGADVHFVEEPLLCSQKGSTNRGEESVVFFIAVDLFGQFFIEHLAVLNSVTTGN